MKNLLSLVLLLLATTLYAAEQFPIIPIGSDNNTSLIFKEKNGNSFIHSTVNTTYTITLNNNPSQHKITIGASSVNGNNNKVNFNIILTDLGDKLNESYQLLDGKNTFKNGSKAAFWIMVDGVEYNSKDFTYVLKEGAVTYTHDKTGISFTVNAYDPGATPPNGPVGQPLPSVWLLLLLGGAGILFWQVRKNRKIA